MNALNNEMQLLIPAAGFGRRVGNPESKEMLLDRFGEPLIAFALNQAQVLGVHAHVITRVEKKNLLRYLEERQWQQSLTIQLIQPDGEWPESLLKSQDHWCQYNIVVLPDTVWSPKNILSRIQKELISFSACYGVFKTEDLKTWGAVCRSEKALQVIEKPQDFMSGFQPWGIFGFQSQVGQRLLEAHSVSTRNHEVQNLQLSSSFVEMESFKDLTREAF